MMKKKAWTWIIVVSLILIVLGIGGYLMKDIFLTGLQQYQPITDDAGVQYSCETKQDCINILLESLTQEELAPFIDNIRCQQNKCEVLA